MNAQNLAVCFGPVLLSQGPGKPGDHSLDSWHPTLSSTVDFKHHIEVLHYLLQTWPGNQPRGGDAPSMEKRKNRAGGGEEGKEEGRGMERSTGGLKEE